MMKKIIIGVFLFSVGFLSAQNIDYNPNKDPIQSNQLQIYSNQSFLQGKFNGIQIKGNPPIVIIDGKKASMEELENISPKNIDAIEILKNEDALKLHGDTKDDVIIITTKKKYFQLEKTKEDLESEPILAI